MRYTTSILAACASLAIAGAAQATTISNGDLSMGLFDNGGLGSGGVGLALTGAGDAITPGCLCEGWGVAANGVGNKYVYGGSSAGFTSAALSDVTASSAKSVVTTNDGLTITHTYTPVAGETLFKIDVVIKNDSGAARTDVRYARTLDWDVTPGYFGDNYTSVYVPGVAPEGKVMHTSTNPFAVPVGRRRRPRQLLHLQLRRPRRWRRVELHDVHRCVHDRIRPACGLRGGGR